MFLAFIILVELGSGQAQFSVDEGTPYKTYTECVAAMTQRAEEFKPFVEMADKKLIGFGCIKKPENKT